MNRKQLATAFATQSAPKGTASAMYFTGPVAYSYGPHFPLAILTGPRAATLNTDRYSATTSRHQSIIRLALSNAGFTITEVDTDTMKGLVA